MSRKKRKKAVPLVCVIADAAASARSPAVTGAKWGATLGGSANVITTPEKHKEYMVERTMYWSAIFGTAGAALGAVYGIVKHIRSK